MYLTGLLFGIIVITFTYFTVNGYLICRKITRRLNESFRLNAIEAFLESAPKTAIPLQLFSLFMAGVSGYQSAVMSLRDWLDQESGLSNQEVNAIMKIIEDEDVSRPGSV